MPTFTARGGEEVTPRNAFHAVDPAAIVRRGCHIRQSSSRCDDLMPDSPALHRLI